MTISKLTIEEINAALLYLLRKIDNLSKKIDELQKKLENK